MRSINGNTDSFKMENLIEALENADKDLLKVNFPQLYYALLDIQDDFKGESINNNIFTEASYKLDRDMQLGIAIEECSELIKAICKFNRGKEHNVEEEVVDVKIMVSYLEEIFDKNKIKEWEKIKLLRLRGLINSK